MFSITNGWQDLHHAILIEGGVDAKEKLLENLSILGFSKVGNPDYSELILESMGVDDARDMTLWATMKPIRETRKVALVCSTNITVEAQNALLKTLEEPPEDTYIFFVVEKARSLLPTLLSRMHFYAAEEEPLRKDAINFLDSGVSERLATVKKLSKKEDKSSLKDLARNIEREILLRGRKQKIKASVLRMVLDGSQYSGIRGGSPRMILEWLATCL